MLWAIAFALETMLLTTPSLHSLVECRYRWLAKAQPDIDDFHLKQVVAMLRTYLTTKATDGLYDEAFRPLRMDLNEVDCVVFWE